MLLDGSHGINESVYQPPNTPKPMMDFVGREYLGLPYTTGTNKKCVAQSFEVKYAINGLQQMTGQVEVFSASLIKCEPASLSEGLLYPNKSYTCVANTTSTKFPAQEFGNISLITPSGCTFHNLKFAEGVIGYNATTFMATRSLNCSEYAHDKFGAYRVIRMLSTWDGAVLRGMQDSYLLQDLTIVVCTPRYYVQQAEVTYVLSNDNFLTTQDIKPSGLENELDPELGIYLTGYIQGMLDYFEKGV